MKSALMGSHQTLQAKEGRFPFSREPRAQPGRVVGGARPALGPGVPPKAPENPGRAGARPRRTARPALRGWSRLSRGPKPPPSLRGTGGAEDAGEQVTWAPNQDDVKRKKKLKHAEQSLHPLTREAGEPGGYALRPGLLWPLPQAPRARSGGPAPRSAPG